MGLQKFLCAAVASFGILAAYAGAAISPARAAVINAPADVQAISKIEHALASATNMKSIIGYYAPDALVYDIFFPGVYRGRTQIFAAFQKQFDAASSVVGELPELNVVSDGQFACAAMQVTAQTTMKNGQKFPVTVRQLDAFKKIDGQWQIVQEHLSVPADPANGMAVWDGPVIAGGPLVFPPNPPFGPAVPAAQAKAEIRKWLETGALSTSIDQLMGYYGPDDDVLVFDQFTPGLMRGRQAIHDYYAPVMGSFDQVHDDFTALQIDSDGQFGVQIDMQTIAMHLKSGGVKTISLRESDCMRRVDGRWYSFFEMNSFPADVKTGKAVMVAPRATE